MDDERFTLATAMQAGRNDDHARWVGEFLASPGSDNAVLAAALADQPRWWLGPVQLPIDRLVPLAGPDESGSDGPHDRVICPIEEGEWEGDVDEMHDHVEQGWEPPPLLAEYRDGELLLQDGNHRHETLRRAGRAHVWVIVWFDDEDDRDHVAASLASGEPVG